MLASQSVSSGGGGCGGGGNSGSNSLPTGKTAVTLQFKLRLKPFSRGRLFPYIPTAALVVHYVPSKRPINHHNGHPPANGLRDE